MVKYRLCEEDKKPGQVDRRILLHRVVFTFGILFKFPGSSFWDTKNNYVNEVNKLHVIVSVRLHNDDTNDVYRQ